MCYGSIFPSGLNFFETTVYFFFFQASLIFVDGEGEGDSGGPITYHTNKYGEFATICLGGL